MRDSLAETLASRGYDVSLASGVEPALTILSRAPVDIVLTDLKLAGESGLDLIKKMTALSQDTPVIVLTGFGTIASAVECIKAGASDYLLKPADPETLYVTLERVLGSRALEREVSYLRGAAADSSGPALVSAVGQSAPWVRLIDMVRTAAPSDAAVLLLGESGTGKDLIARMLHSMSSRAAGPFVRVNCAAIPLEMWESEFFGHRRGSFTGASADREGRFRLAHRGTLFMDEIGSMPVAAQAKILRALQDGEFDRLGDEQPTRVDVRVIAATNSDLDAEVAAGRFRQDLFYRLDVVRISVPPLRDRTEDIPLLAARFVGEISRRLGRPAPEIGDEILADLKAYHWPGNVRELRNAIERALILSPAGAALAFDLPPVPESSPASPESPSRDLNLRAALLRREKEVVIEAVKRSAGVRKEAARFLGIDQRNLGYYLRKHGINPDDSGE